MDDFIALGIGVAIGICAVIGSWAILRRRSKPEVAAVQPPAPNPEILLLKGTVIDSAPEVSTLLGEPVIIGMDWENLRRALEARFDVLPEHLPSEPIRVSSLTSSEDYLKITPEHDRHRISLHLGDLTVVAPDGYDLTPAEKQRLITVCQTTPTPIWLTTAKGFVLWSNAAFDALCEQAGHSNRTSSPFVSSDTQDPKSAMSRAHVPMPDGSKRWYEVTVRQSDIGALHFAICVDNLVEAEMAQRNFVQTLTKTFAHLPIGLAVFDRDRRLVLFNPALVDLTRLPVDFLSARPNLMSFFDHMRENRMMPEPKNYNSWRDQLTDVVAAARDDRYCETWNLPSGLTYKITGRPHPDGAVAFLLEDISAEITLTRRFRSELELTQSVIDCFEDAVAVFSQLGVLTFCNRAFRELWKCDPDSAFVEMTIVDAAQEWERACQPSPIWSDMQEFVLTLRDRSSWTAPLTMKTGEHLSCTVEPVAAGATLIRFAIRPAVQRAPTEMIERTL